MKLENQVTSLELSKKLKELGVKQESLYVWGSNIDGARISPKQKDYLLIGIDRKGEYPNIFQHTYFAFTVAELGEMLPDYITDEKLGILQLRIFKLQEDWIVEYINRDAEKRQMFGNTEANARAKCLIYLIENGIIKNDEKVSISGNSHGSSSSLGETK